MSVRVRSPGAIAPYGAADDMGRGQEDNSRSRSLGQNRFCEGRRPEAKKASCLALISPFVVSWAPPNDEFVITGLISPRGGEIQKDDARRISHPRVASGEPKASRLPVHVENGHVVGPLVATVEEATRGIEIETARIISARPLFTQEGELPGGAHGEDRRTVVKPVAGVNEPAVSRDQNLGTEVASRVSGRKRGNRPAGRQASRAAVVVEENDRRTFFLNAVEPLSVGVEVEMPRPVARGQGDRGRIVRIQHSFSFVESPYEYLVQAQVDMEYETARGIGLDHVGVRSVVSAYGETARRRTGRLGGTDFPRRFLDVGRLSETSVLKDGQYRDRPSEIVGDEEESFRRVEAHVSGAGSS